MTLTTLPSPSAMQAWVARQLLDALPLEISARIVGVCFTLAVGRGPAYLLRQAFASSTKCRSGAVLKQL